MNNLIEIRWHGRGGQGAKTASLLLADAAFNTGKYIQGFPEYGPERMGAPITAYNRISSSPITIHSNIYEPDYVVVVDDTSSNSYPMPITATGHDEVFVGRIRKDESVKNGINMWVVADNIRKGAASNAIQIVEKLVISDILY